MTHDEDVRLVREACTLGDNFQYLKLDKHRAALDRILTRYDALVAAWKAQDANYNAADAVLSGRINYEEREAYNYDAWAAHDKVERLLAESGQQPHDGTTTHDREETP